MTSALAIPAAPRPLVPRLETLNTRAALWGIIGMVMVLQVYLALTKGINWDEFFHFSQLHEHARGQFINPVQTPHVWLFGWILGLPGDSISHILAIRLLILPFELIVLAVIVDLARRFASYEASLLALLAYACGGYVMTQALALRADMIAAALLMAALWIVLVRPARALDAAVAALFVAVAAVATIKSVFYAPAFAGVAWLRWQRKEDRRALAICAATVAVVLPLTFGAIVSLLQPDVAAGQVGSAVGGTARGAAKHVFGGGLLPRGEYLVRQAMQAPVMTIMLAFTPAVILTARLGPARRIALFALLTPIVSIAVYTNAYPYFYAFILPPAMIAMAPTLERAAQRWGTVSLAAVLAILALCVALIQDRGVLDRQRAVLGGIHQMFPQPVWHFSEDNMPGEYPRATRFLMSGWGLKNYRWAGKPLLSQTMDRETVPFVLANGNTLNGVFNDPAWPERLLPADETRLRDSYIPHWGQVFVAGKHVAAGTSATRIDVHVPGTYTVEDAPLAIDGRAYRVGEKVDLTRGVHAIGGPRTASATLRWGDHLVRPAMPYPAGLLYSIY